MRQLVIFREWKQKAQLLARLDEGIAVVDIVYLDFSKAFDTVSHKILIEKLMKYGLDEQTGSWIENWLNGWTFAISDLSSL